MPQLDAMGEESDKLIRHSEEHAMHCTCREYQCPCHDKLKVLIKFLEDVIECLPGTSVAGCAMIKLREIGHVKAR